MAFVWSDVVAVAPELSTYPVGLQTIMLARAVESIDPAQFCGDDTADYALAVRYLAAHFATDQKLASANAANPGKIQSESVGGLSVSYGSFGVTRGATANSRAVYESTSYGALFLGLLRSSPCSGFAINVV